ncbi:MAG: protein kinase domain-containing protein [Bryobacteraceae bacterium]
MDRWQEVETLFRGALEQPPDERRAWLRSACGNDRELLREVGSLVSNHSDNDPGAWAAIAAAQLVAPPAAVPGQLIGHYELLQFIGAGGMGEVYRARDSKLGREVALKLLPAAFAKDTDRLARFTREAQLLASLNHPNISALYGVEDEALVMELVDGRTLAEHIATEPLGRDQVLSIMRQVAEALEYAHEKGIVHRDLKPANIKLTPEGRVKVLDFGLAKALSGEAFGSSNLTPATVSDPIGGALIGTAAYMAPEQARGVAVDKRADVWSFGVVLYELLSRRRAFQGDTVPETLVAVLKTGPDWNALADDTAPALRRLLRRCLERDRRHRLRDMGDAIIEIDDALAQHTQELEVAVSPVVSRTALLRLRVLLGAVSLLAVALLITTAMLVRANRAVERPLIRLNVDLGPDVLAGTSTTVIISRDGRRLVFPVRGASGKQLLATRLLDEAKPTLLTGTEDAADPFFSPDGQWVAFFAEAKLKKVSVSGGAPITLCSSVNPRGATWGEDNDIIGAFNFVGPLLRVRDTGGTPQPLSRLGRGEATHRWPQVLPGGDAIVFTASSDPIGHEDDDIEVLSLKTGQVKRLLHGGYFGRYVPSGHLLYVHQGVLFGVGFDVARLQVHGTPVPLVDDAAVNPITAGGQFHFSEAPSGPGILLYLAGTSAAQKWQVDWLNASGNTQPLIGTPGVYTVPRISPDGRKLAFIGSDSVPQIYDLDRDTITRITSAGGGGNLAWAPDGKHVAFGYGGSLFWIRSDGVGGPQRLVQRQPSLAAWSFSPDGHWLAYFEMTNTGSNIGVLPLDTTNPDHPKAGTPQVFSRTQANEIFPRFSPDGHWIAYRSDELGNNEIWVRPFPAGNDARYQISSGGAMYPFWSSKRHQLFYETTDHRIMVVDFRVEGDVFKPGKPRIWSSRQIFYAGVSNMDIAPDGERFAVLAAPRTPAGEKSSVHVRMLLNYFDELKRRIP